MRVAAKNIHINIYKSTTEALGGPLKVSSGIV